MPPVKHGAECPFGGTGIGGEVEAPMAGARAAAERHPPEPSKPPAGPLTITALGMIADPEPGSHDTALAEYAGRVILERTGVGCEWPAPPADWTLERLVRESEPSGTMPHVFAVGGLLKEPATRTAIIDRGIAHEITADLVERCMPAYTERVRRWGWNVEEILRTNQCNGRPLCLPMQFGFDEFPGLIGHPGARDAAAGYYALGMRDDILKRVYPSARTESELRELLALKGCLTVGDLIDDIPLRNLEDLRRYLAKVKSLGVPADPGDGPLVPGSLLASYENLWSLQWSLCSAAGLFYDRPFIAGDPPGWERTSPFWLTTEFQKYLRWWNRIYHEGLVGEPFSLTDRELGERVLQGRYAVINDWGWRGDAGDARRAAQVRGYGYRYFPVFVGSWTDIWDNYAQPVERREIPLVFTRRIRNHNELTRVLRWADWYMSEERDTLAYWGMPDWYVGHGGQRRYTWKAAALEDWAVYGILSERDGAAAGLEHTPAVEWNPCRSVKVPLGPLSFFAPERTYPEAPYWVYPRDGRKVLRTNDFRSYCASVVKAARADEYLVWYRGQLHREMFYVIPGVYEYFAASDPWNPAFSGLLRDAITCPADRFERACEAIRRFHVDHGLEKGRRVFIDYLKDVYPKLIEPNIILDRRARTPRRA